MIEALKSDDIVNKVGGKFKLCALIQRRLIQLMDGSAENRTFATRAGLEQVSKVADGIGPALDYVVTPQTNGTYRITDLVTNAHALKLEVHPFTFRADDLPKYAGSLEELFRVFFLEARVDGVFTDFPDRGVAFRREH